MSENKTPEQEAREWAYSLALSSDDFTSEDWGYDGEDEFRVTEFDNDKARAQLAKAYLAGQAVGEQRGIGSVMRIRCMNHRDVTQLNSSEITGGECGACVQEEASENMLRAVSDWFDISKYRRQIWERYEEIKTRKSKGGV